MRSEFERLLKQHRDALTDELVKLGKHRQVQLVEWDIERNETDYEFYFDGAWNAQQSKIDEFHKISVALNTQTIRQREQVAYYLSKNAELQKRVDAAHDALTELKEKSEALHHRWQIFSDSVALAEAEMIDMCVKDLEQALKGGGE